MKRRSERRERRGQLEKLPELISHLTLSKQNVQFLLLLRPFLLFALVSGSERLSDVEPISTPPSPRRSPIALKCIGCFRAEWTGLGRELGSPNGKPCGASRHGINQAAKRTPEKVPSKQTDLSHDSRGAAGPHRSQLATLSQWEYSAESTMQSFLWHQHCDLMPH